MCQLYQHRYNCIGEKLTIAAGSAQFGGLDSSGRSPYDVMLLLRKRPVCLWDQTIV